MCKITLSLSLIAKNKGVLSLKFEILKKEECFYNSKRPGIIKFMNTHRRLQLINKLNLYFKILFTAQAVILIELRVLDIFMQESINPFS